MTELSALIAAALARRQELFARLAAENTDCYRLFHGSNEGLPGLTVDRYGPLLVIQSFYTALDAEAQADILAAVHRHFAPAETVYVERFAAKRPAAATGADYVCHELGLRYRVRSRHAGRDPLLFLDMRAGRRWVLNQAKGLSVLNLFAYTCGLGLCAAAGGASEVWNIDFAERNLQVGRENAELNGFAAESFRLIKSDFFPAVRQLAGLPIQGRRGQKPRPYLQMAPRQFDLVCLDPPGWAKSPFGTVDLIRDYPSVLKPAVLATKPGGRLLCANNVAAVELESWLDVLQRCATKAGRPPQAIDLLTPEADFPSSDGRHPLKLAVVQL